MAIRSICALAVFVLISATAHISASAQGTQPQIPSLQVCNKTTASGSGTVRISSRVDATHSGRFTVTLELRCDADNQYPVGSLRITDISMSDSMVQGTIDSTGFEQVTSTGKHSPTLYLNGRCRAANITGCRYWLIVADNKSAGVAGTADVVGFLVFDGTGKRIAYGTGPLASGDLDVQDTSN